MCEVLVANALITVVILLAITPFGFWKLLYQFLKNSVSQGQ